MGVYLCIGKHKFPVSGSLVIGSWRTCNIAINYKRIHGVHMVIQRTSIGILVQNYADTASIHIDGKPMKNLSGKLLLRTSSLSCAGIKMTLYIGSEEKKKMNANAGRFEEKRLLLCCRKCKRIHRTWKLKPEEAQALIESKKRALDDASEANVVLLGKLKGLKIKDI